MTLGPKPYYWHNTSAVSYGNSPPIATRAGWMALGLLPFVLYVLSFLFWDRKKEEDKKLMKHTGHSRQKQTLFQR
jgi:hypothetical protein